MAKAQQRDLIVLRAKKVKETQGPYKGLDRTELYLNGTLKATIPASGKQPKKGTKTYTLNGWRFGLDWGSTWF